MAYECLIMKVSAGLFDFVAILHFNMFSMPLSKCF